MNKKLIFSPNLDIIYQDWNLLQRLQNLNLEIIKARMIDKYQWSEDKFNAVSFDYLKYLYLTQKYEKPLSPTKDIDIVWHEHILHTNKYALDCQKLFGTFLHHFPTPVYWKNSELKLSECEGKCENDSCDGGTTNCESPPADCAKNRVELMNYDYPDIKHKSVSVNFGEIEQSFFIS